MVARKLYSYDENKTVEDFVEEVSDYNDDLYSNNIKLFDRAFRLNSIKLSKDNHSNVIRFIGVRFRLEKKNRMSQLGNVTVVW